MIRGSLRGPKRTISPNVQRIISEMAGVSEAEGTFRKTQEFASKDGKHVWRAGKNTSAGTWDHRHYSKQGNGWKHHADHGYDGHDSAEDAAAAAKADRDAHDSGKKIDESTTASSRKRPLHPSVQAVMESYRSFGDDEHAMSADAQVPTDMGGATDPVQQAAALSKRHNTQITWDGQQFVQAGVKHPVPIGATAEEVDARLRGQDTSPRPSPLGKPAAKPAPATMPAEPVTMGAAALDGAQAANPMDPAAPAQQPKQQVVIKPKIVLKGKGAPEAKKAGMTVTHPADPELDNSPHWNPEVARRQAEEERSGRQF